MDNMYMYVMYNDNTMQAKIKKNMSSSCRPNDNSNCSEDSLLHQVILIRIDEVSELQLTNDS